MRILFLNDLHDPRIGSSIRQMYQQAARLAQLGHEAEILSTTTDPAQVGQQEILGVPVTRLLSDYNPRWRAWVGLDNPRVKQGVAETLERFCPDVVHAHLIHTHLSYASLTRARESGAGVVFTAHDVMTFCYQKLTCFHGGEAAGGLLRDYEARLSKCLPCQRLRLRPGRNAAIAKILQRDVHRLTVVSDELGRALKANQIRVDCTVHNAISVQSKLPEAGAVAAFRAERGLEGKLIVAIGGRLHEQKGMRQLLKMLALLAPDFPSLRLLVMGKAEIYQQEFEPLARELGVAERVVATGWLDGLQLQQALAASDIFVTPSICLDTFGMVNLEAMEHSKPVVATVFGGSSEVVQAGVTGAVANPFDVPAFAAELAKLLRDPVLRRTQGRAGRQRLLDHFGIERLTTEFLKVYGQAMGAAGR